MRIQMIRLKGYLGINNGLLRNEIIIDFSNAKHKICLIKGDTGSGKTTILDAISPLPDENYRFVPGEQAEKEIIYNNGIRILIIHPVTANGERATTKASIYEHGKNLNPNGNVTSFKEIVFEKLELDSNFEALTKLSSRDRGLADKTPAVRKKYVANIIDSVDVFNNMYKTLNKHSNTLKSMLNSIVAKMDSIGNEKSIDDNINNIETLLSQYVQKKEEIVANNTAALATIKALDPDGTIAKNYNYLSSQQQMIDNSIANCQSYIVDFCNKYSSSDKINVQENSTIGTFISDNLERFKIEETQISSDINMENEKIRGLLDRSEIDNKNLASKIAKLKSLTNDSNFDILCSNIDKVNSELKEIEKFFREINIKDALSLSSKEYELGLSILQQLSDMIEAVYSKYGNEIISKAITITDYDNYISQYQNEIREKENIISELKQSISEFRGQTNLYNILKQRPSECKIDDCPFIKSAIGITTNPEISIQKCTEQINSINVDIISLKECLDKFILMRQCYTDICSIIDRCNDNSYILSKLPLSYQLNGNTLIDGFKTKTSWYEIIPDTSVIMSNMRKAYMFDEYKRLVSERDRLDMQKQVFESKHSVIDEIQSDIEYIKTQLNDVSDKIQTSRDKIAELSSLLENKRNLVSVFSNALETCNKLKTLISDKNSIVSELNKMSSSIGKINDARATIYATQSSLDEIEQAIKPMQEDLNRYKFNKQRLEEYKVELEDYKEKYELTETVKMYTSPTKEGIQLLFMDMYMHKILSTANNLLAKMFGGQFMLKPFIINGDEFRIPCIGNRLMNDDISSMSNGQICMISMILNFSILVNSSSKYNIIKLDEIDGGLDTESRTNFITVLNEIMDILGCEQCFLISHNEEIQYSSTDMIVLKTSSESSYYGDANIIFDAAKI